MIPKARFPLDVRWLYADVPTVLRKSYIAPVAWDALRLDYVNGNGKVRDLAVQHGINPGTAEQKAKRERWTAERSAFLLKKRELMLNPVLTQTPVLDPPNGSPPYSNETSENVDFSELNRRFHALASPLLFRIEEMLHEMTLPQTPTERLASANAFRTLTQTAREVLGIPLVAPIKRKPKRVSFEQFCVPVPIEAGSSLDGPH